MSTPIPILVIDDQPHIVDLLSRAAKNIFPQAQFIALPSFEQAVAYLRELKEPFPRLVLLDIDLQSAQSGFDFLALFRQHPKVRLVPVIVLSVDRSQSEQAYDRGANAFTHKPESLAGWQLYVQQLQNFWFKVATLPKL